MTVKPSWRHQKNWIALTSTLFNIFQISMNLHSLVSKSIRGPERVMITITASRRLNLELNVGLTVRCPFIVSLVCLRICLFFIGTILLKVLKKVYFSYFFPGFSVLWLWLHLCQDLQWTFWNLFLIRATFISFTFSYWWRFLTKLYIMSYLPL